MLKILNEIRLRANHSLDSRDAKEIRRQMINIANLAVAGLKGDVDMKTKKCLARVQINKDKPGKVRFCGEIIKFGDLCRKHERKMASAIRFDKEIHE